MNGGKILIEEKRPFQLPDPPLFGRMPLCFAG
jgi:hypothetical protein